MRLPFTDSSLHLRSWGEQIHLFRATPVAQRLLQLQTVLRVSGWSGFPDVQRRHPVPRLRQGHLSEIHQKTTRAGLAACRHAQQHSPNFAWFESFISVLNINMFFYACTEDTASYVNDLQPLLPIRISAFCSENIHTWNKNMFYFQVKNAVTQIYYVTAHVRACEAVLNWYHYDVIVTTNVVCSN